MRSVAICLLILFSFKLADAQTNHPEAVRKNLQKVNSHWRSFNDWVFLEAHANNAHSTGDDLIQAHLLLVHQYLSDHPPIALNEDLKEKREQLLYKLHAYAIESAFPQNRTYKDPTPIFIDDEHNYCAVAYLIFQTDGCALAEDINRTHHTSYLKDIANAYPVEQWAEMYGFTLEELAWIQPTYDFRPLAIEIRDRYLAAGSGLSILRIKDQLLSDEINTGTGWTTQLIYDKYKNKHRISASVDMTKAGLEHETTSFDNFRLQAALRYWRHSRFLNKVAVYYGGGLSINHGFRWNADDNWNITSYDGTLSVDLSLRARRGFSVRDRKLALEYMLDLPAVSYLMRNDQLLDPAMDGLQGKSFNDLYSKGIWVSWGGWQRIQTGLAVEYFLTNHNRFRVAYLLDAYKVIADAPLRHAQHGFVLSVMTRF